MCRLFMMHIYDGTTDEREMIITEAGQSFPANVMWHLHKAGTEPGDKSFLCCPDWTALRMDWD